MNFLNPFKKRGARRIAYIHSASALQPAGGSAAVRNHDDRIQQLEATMSSLQPPHDHAEHLDKSRAKIAFTFVRWYFVLIFIVVIGLPIYGKWIGNAQTIDLNGTLTQLGTLLGTPLGFVVGYYFKEDRKK